ncbi:glycosyltransferase family 4 protein [Halodesulfovibrio aestuarii]|uniref:Glycosyltransferase family 4 protein n=1 Tax=Halodesulfovibrio aestuarii TaxID=126333 RepID=A0ABV4JW08_9BACT
MKILVLSFYYPPDLCAGSFRCVAFVDALKKTLPEDSSIDVITTFPNRYRSFEQQAEEHEQQDGVTIHRIHLPVHKSGMLDQSKAFFTYAARAFALVKTEQYDLVVGTSSRLLTATLASFVSRYHNIPLYLDIRDIFVDTIKDVLPRRIATVAKPVFSLVEKWTMRRADKINLVSEGFKEYFRQRYPDKKLSFYPNGIDSVFLKAPQSVEGELKQSELCIRIVYAGNIGEGQGLHSIVPQLAKRIGDTGIIQIIGDGGRKTQLEQEIVKLGVNNVELCSPVNRDELLNVYRNADVLFLHLNEYDAFKKVLPSKLFEYAALGKPILAGVAGYAAQFVKQEIKNAVVFSPCDVEAAATVFQQLKIEETPRPDFIQKFSREKIMCQLAADVVRIVS